MSLDPLIHNDEDMLSTDDMYSPDDNDAPLGKLCFELIGYSMTIITFVMRLDLSIPNSSRSTNDTSSPKGADNPQGKFYYIPPVGDEQKPLATMKKHLQVREKANIAYRKNVEMMKKKYAKNSKIMKYKIGDYVSVRIPRIDRASTDLQRLPCVVVGIIGKAQQLYRLRCKDGVLKSCLPASELELYEGKFKSDGWGDKRITLREAELHGTHLLVIFASANQDHARPKDVDVGKMELTVAVIVIMVNPVKIRSIFQIHLLVSLLLSYSHLVNRHLVNHHQL